MNRVIQTWVWEDESILTTEELIITQAMGQEWWEHSSTDLLPLDWLAGHIVFVGTILQPGESCSDTIIPIRPISHQIILLELGSVVPPPYHTKLCQEKSSTTDHRERDPCSQSSSRLQLSTHKHTAQSSSQSQRTNLPPCLHHSWESLCWIHYICGHLVHEMSLCCSWCHVLSSLVGGDVLARLITSASNFCVKWTWTI